MKLLTDQLLKDFKKIGSQEKVKDPIVVARFFNPAGAGHWYATEYDPKEEIFFGYVSIFGDHNDEWGSFSLEELTDFTGKFGSKIERDLFSRQEPISKVIPKAII